jgi:hypothetical protein
VVRREHGTSLLFVSDLVIDLFECEGQPRYYVGSVILGQMLFVSLQALPLEGEPKIA